MIYRGRGFLAIVLFGSSLDLSPSQPSEARPATHRKTEKERQLADGRERGSGGGAKSYDGEKQSMILKNHSILPGMNKRIHTLQ
jgi:hypothetical protein